MEYVALSEGQTVVLFMSAALLLGLLIEMVDGYYVESRNNDRSKK